MVSEFQIGTRDRAGAFPVFLISKLGTPSPGAGLTLDECKRRLAFNWLDEITIDAAIAKQMSMPLFLDQIDRAARLTGALRAIKAAPCGNWTP